MNQDQQAGYFSTFSALDPDRATLEGHGRPQKRNRRVYVCIPCHRRKLKCDKGQPCSRCAQSGAPDDCVYQQHPAGAGRDASTESRTPRRSAQPSPKPAPSSIPDDEKPRLNGVTHWSTIAFEFREGWPYISGADPVWEPTYRQIHSHKYLFDSLSGFNFPFGSIYSFSRTRDQVLLSLPTPQIVHVLVQSYFGAFEPIYRLFHRQQFEDELSAFWLDSSQCSEEWLGQLFMVLALGSQAAPDHIPAGIGVREDWTDRFLDAAQFFFNSSPYYTAPSLASVQTMCLVLVAQMLGIVKGAEMAQLVSLMGFLSRSSMALHIHRDPSLLPGLNPFEAEMRRRIWTTVQLLDLDVGLRTGTSYIHNDHDAITPLNLNDTDIYRTDHGWALDRRRASPQDTTDSTFQVKLAELLPSLVKIVNNVNSPTKPPLAYEKVQTLDGQLRQQLRDAESALSPKPQELSHHRDTHKIQMDFLRVLVNRTLLALNHHYVSAPRFQQYPQSATATLQSAQVILRIQQTWHHQIQSNPDPGPSSTPSPPTAPTHWLLDLCRDDFTAALLYYILSTRRLALGPTQPPQPTPPSEQSSSSSLTIIQHSLVVVRARAGRSAAHFDDFATLLVAAGCLEALTAGQPIMTVLPGMAEQIEQTAVAVGGRQGGLWTEGGLFG